MEEKTTRTCVKCRKHGKVVPLKNHKKNCPYEYCSCQHCCAHNKDKEQKRSVHSESTMSTQSVLDVADVELSAQVVAKNISAADKKLEQKKKRLEKHRDLYTKVNEFSKEISSAMPQMNPLQVMKKAIQLHQSGMRPDKVKEEGKQRETFLVMPDFPVQSSSNSNSYILEEDKLDHLCGAFPAISRSRLAVLLINENGDINGVISSLMMSEEESSRKLDDCSDILKTEELAVADIAARSTITSHQLQSILDNIKAQEQSTGVSNILSFHSRPGSRAARQVRQQQATATCTSTAATSGNTNALSRALSSSPQSSDNHRICSSCLNIVECDFAFCPQCGQLNK